MQFKDELLITPTEDANSDKKDSDNGDVSSTTASGKDTPSSARRCVPLPRECSAIPEDVLRSSRALIVLEREFGGSTGLPGWDEVVSSPS